jgi:serine/threonine protein phosphatase 1
MKKYAITDIHGCVLSFEALLDKLALSTADELYLLGDYIDRGPDSKRVLDKIMQLREDGYTVHCLAGNHDFAMLDAKTDVGFRSDWYHGWGGEQTMDSFDVKTLDEVDWKYWEFITDLEMVIEVDDYILVHAGLDFAAKDPLRPDVNMLYLRNWHDQINSDWLGDRVIVHGHTPVSKHEAERMLHRLPIDQVIDIDTGCFAQHLPGKGQLCAFDLGERALFFQKNIDDVSAYWAGKR